MFQFEAIARNRLGYNKGLAGMAADPIYTEDWKDYILTLRTRLGDVDFADLIFVRSEQFVRERLRLNPDFVPKFPVLFGEKEGKIARANRGRDPMYLFAALQRQLGYPEVPRTAAAGRARGPRGLARAAHRPARKPPQGRRERPPSRRRPLPGPRQTRRYRRSAEGVGKSVVSCQLLVVSSRTSNPDRLSNMRLESSCRRLLSTGPVCLRVAGGLLMLRNSIVL